jgi:XTP/dITP diphosphohydrolase
LNLFLATSNLGKIREVQRQLGEEFDCVGTSDPQFAHLQAPAVEENGQTYYENALKKALAYYEVYQLPVLADDSGLEVDALNGQPGVHSARFGGDTLPWPARWGLLHAKLLQTCSPPWPARFRCVLCYYDGRRVPRFFEGKAEGEITKEVRGNQGFGYDPIFRSYQLGKTFGEASESEKERTSHRAEALRHFLAWTYSLA